MIIHKNRDLYENTVELVNKVGALAGVDFLLRNIKKPITFWGYTTWILIGFTTVCNLYSMFYFRDNWLHLAFILTTFGLLSAFAIKAYVVFKSPFYAHDIIAEVFKIIDRIGDEREKCEEMQKGLKRFDLIFRMIKTSYIVVSAVMFVFTFVISIYEKKKTLLVGYIVPFLNYEKFPGYEINIICNMLQAYISVIVFIAFDAFYFGHLFIACSHNLVMIHYVRDFNKFVNEDGEIVDEKELRSALLLLSLNNRVI
uniref:Uncharacterized protein n=1 Tax=Phlebotomus papatasi TaxID=29031 RepID=A0A3F2ZE84_PHLPP